MHFYVLVVGEDHRLELEPFDTNRTTAPYELVCPFCSLKRSPGEQRFDLVDASPDCPRCDGRGNRASDFNYIGRWDSWRVTQAQLRFRTDDDRLPPARGESANSGIDERHDDAPERWDRGRWRDVDLAALDGEAREEEHRMWERMKDEPRSFDRAEHSTGGIGGIGRIRPGESRDEFIARRGIWAVSNVVRDGIWHTIQKPDWRVVFRDLPTWLSRIERHEEHNWLQEFRHLLEETLPEAIVTLIYCHG